MRLQQGVAVRSQLQLSQPERHLVGAEGAAAGQLHIQQPVVQHGGFRSVPVKQELLFRLLPQQPVLDAKLVVGELDLLHAGKLNRFEIRTELMARVVPEHDALLLKQIGQRLLDLDVTHLSVSVVCPCSRRSSPLSVRRYFCKRLLGLSGKV